MQTNQLNSRNMLGTAVYTFDPSTKEAEAGCILIFCLIKSLNPWMTRWKQSSQGTMPAGSAELVRVCISACGPMPGDWRVMLGILLCHFSTLSSEAVSPANPELAVLASLTSQPTQRFHVHLLRLNLQVNCHAHLAFM